MMNTPLTEAIDRIRNAEKALVDGLPRDALAILDKSWPPGMPDQHVPPRVHFLRGAATLRLGRHEGVTQILSAASRDPSLLARAAQALQQWLEGPGRKHDTPDLRAEIARMRNVHAQALAERENVDGEETLSLADQELTEAIGHMLSAHGENIRVAWLAERHCRHAPAWRHFELLLEMKPRPWLFLASARSRLENLCQRIETALPLPEGTLRVRAFPMLARPLFVRNMRWHGSRLDLVPSQKDAPETPPPQPFMTKRSESPPERRFGLALRSSWLAALLLLPAWQGYQWISRNATKERLLRLEQAHTARIATRYWRDREAADTFAPEKVVHAFIDALKAADADPSLPILDEETRRHWNRFRMSKTFMHALAARWRGCGPARVKVELNRAVVRWPLNKPSCMPLLLRREKGRWRLAWRATTILFRRMPDGSWRLRTRLPHGWLFGFRELSFNAAGAPMRLAGAPGKSELIVPFFDPHYENRANAGEADLAPVSTTLHNLPELRLLH